MEKTHFRLLGAAVAGLTSWFALQAKAQEEPLGNDNRCWFLSESYTAGVKIRAGSEVMICGNDGIWSEADDGAGASGCFYEHKFFGTGATVAVKDGPITACQPNGSWSSQ